MLDQIFTDYVLCLDGAVKTRGHKRAYIAAGLFLSQLRQAAQQWLPTTEVR